MSKISAVFAATKLGEHTVPGIWRYMLPEDVFYYRVDPEKGSSCFACPQVKSHGFHPSIRCCAFWPRIPNFLLGMSLSDPSLRPQVESFINAGFVIPEGSQSSPAQFLRSLQQVESYQAEPKVVCNFLDQANQKCQIYDFRNGVCSTFFCRHDRGEAGALFWEHLQDLVSQIETALAQWALAGIGFDLEAYFKRFDGLATEISTLSEPISRAWTCEARRVLFAEYYGQETRLLERCAELVLDHKNELYEIAASQPLRQTLSYDYALREFAKPLYSETLIQESLPEGQPVSVASIWYSLQLAYRNMHSGQ